MRSRAFWSTGEAPEGVRGSAGSYERGSLARVCDHIGVLAFGALFTVATLRLLRGAPGLELLWIVPPALAVGHLIADLLSGLVHWFADEFFEEDTPLLGPLLIYGFRDHHRDPRGIVAHGVVEVSGYNALASLPALLALQVLPVGTPLARALQAVALATLLSVALTNQLHRWAHTDRERLPVFVTWLQRGRLILSPEGHARHHAHGDRSYCVTVGWWNPLLDRLGLLPAIGSRVHGLARRLGLTR